MAPLLAAVAERSWLWCSTLASTPSASDLTPPFPRASGSFHWSSSVADRRHLVLHETLTEIGAANNAAAQSSTFFRQKESEGGAGDGEWRGNWRMKGGGGERAIGVGEGFGHETEDSEDVGGGLLLCCLTNESTNKWPNGGRGIIYSFWIIQHIIIIIFICFLFFPFLSYWLMTVNVTK